MSGTVLINGQWTRYVDVADRGFQYGDGLFTTVRISQSAPLFLSRHFLRLEQGCQKLMLPYPGDKSLINDIETLCPAGFDGILKIQITRGVGGRGYRPNLHSAATRALSLHPLPDYPAHLSETGIEVRICHTRLGINPSLAGIKHMNRLEQILARAEWDSDSIREGLMLDGEGYVTEGTMSNLFIVKDRILRTPIIDRAGVAGIMRSMVLEMARAREWAVEECRLTLSELFEADEMFLTNCVIGLWPISRCEARSFSIGPISREVSLWLTTAIQQEQDIQCIAG